jgi:hypothetical protein
VLVRQFEPEHSESWLTRVSSGPPYVCAKIICICSKCCPPTRPAGLIVWPGRRPTGRPGLPKRPRKRLLRNRAIVFTRNQSLRRSDSRARCRGWKGLPFRASYTDGVSARNAMESRGGSCKSALSTGSVGGEALPTTVRLPRFLGAGKGDVIVSFHFTLTLAITTVGMA